MESPESPEAKAPVRGGTKFMDSLAEQKRQLVDIVCTVGVLRGKRASAHEKQRKLDGLVDEVENLLAATLSDGRDSHTEAIDKFLDIFAAEPAPFEEASMQGTSRSLNSTRLWSSNGRQRPPQWSDSCRVDLKQVKSTRQMHHRKLHARQRLAELMTQQMTDMSKELGSSQSPTFFEEYELAAE